MSKTIIVVAVSLLAAFWPYARGNDSAASTALGGIQLRREPRVSMLKERLTISLDKVTVEYEFLNETDSDITTEVAFPIPPYSVNFSAAGTRTFDDFKVWVEDAPVPYNTEAKGTINTKDYSALLRKYGIDIASLGHFQDEREPFSADFRKLSPAAQQELTTAELFDPLPQWTVEKTYHWRQTFPSKRILHVRHEYQPGVGFTPVQTYLFKSKERRRRIGNRGNDWLDTAGQIDNACLDGRLENLLVSANQAEPGPQAHYDKGFVHMAWTDYILTTANSWKTPIEDFELIVEKPGKETKLTSFMEGQWYVSFCWDGPVERIDRNRFRARARKFVPKKELHIAFFRVH